VLKLSATRKLAHAAFLVAVALILTWFSLSARAQQPAARQSAGTAPASAAAPSPISTEGELKATVFTFRDGNLVAQYKYYWWRNGCYLNYAPATFAPAPPAACA
jgi:hypothetical protein